MIDILDDLSTRKVKRRTKAEGPNSGKSKGSSGTDIGEVFSPPRMTRMAEELGLSTAFALGLTETDAQGRKWDISGRAAQGSPTALLRTGRCKSRTRRNHG